MVPETRVKVVRRSLDWMFLNRSTGRLTFVQWPNLSLGVFIAASLVTHLFHFGGRPEAALRVLSIAAPLVWGADEIVRGVNPFRRILGAAVSAATLANLILH